MEPMNLQRKKEQKPMTLDEDFMINSQKGMEVFCVENLLDMIWLIPKS
jgi:hypothetical protein